MAEAGCASKKRVKQRFLRKHQAEKLIATWGTCDLWLKIFTKVPAFPGQEVEVVDVLAETTSLSLKVKTCIEEVKATEEIPVFESTEMLASFPEAFW